MRIFTIVSTAFLLAAAIPCQDNDKKQQGNQQSKPTNDPRAELKERMKLRHADLDRLRDGEKVGETWAGLVEVVKDSYAQEKVDPADKKSLTIAELLAAENKDRKALFELLATEQKLTSEAVGKQNGIRTLEKAADNHWLKLEDGRWVHKKSIKPVKK